ncbi:MAG: ShlB/FhaC/HecB family hemolysin secretion/activation protein [Thermovirgaceae bacterium]|nr:ShlB/FhaC/HecB family hemolysin secretion/activation protein [Thermovirgaceae bacterium]
MLPQTKTRTLCLGLLLALICLIPATAYTQMRPDAGLILQDTLKREFQPLAPSVDSSPQGNTLIEIPNGGARIWLNSIGFSGNNVFREEELLSEVGDEIGKSHDLAGLRHIANRISIFYRENGYPFAWAYIPEQSMAGGELVIEVVEGRYGKVSASGDPALSAWAQRFLKTLRTGAVIEERGLQRAILILGGQPGVVVEPIIRPGEEIGTGDLELRAAEKPRISGRAGFDNHGNRYSGEYRGELRLWVNRAFTFGDEISLRALYTNENMWLGQLDYSLPIGYSGLRGHAGYAHTAYDLMAPYEGYTGTAKVSKMGLSCPLVRSRLTNLAVYTMCQYKDLGNELLGTSYEKKSSRSWLLGLQFDHRDAFGGGGVTYGDISLTTGHLDSDNPGEAQGAFTKANLEITRVQNLSSDLTLFLNASGQWADGELDSSESFSLGGANGVKAYPQGEGSGSAGWLAKAELRYAANGCFAPYLFYDAGNISSDSTGASRGIAGAGIGLRYAYDDWSLDASAAWTTHGGDARSDDDQRSPRVWLRIERSF